MTGNGGSEPVYSVKSVSRMGKDTARAIITVRQKWEDGTCAEEDAKEYEVSLTVSEADHLRQKNALTEAEDLQELIDLQAQNKTVREIAAETGFAPTTVHRKIKKAPELGYKLSCSVPFHSGVEQAANS